ncbi:hypothetical protein Scep_012234 [Stephania cephalantha]|uniref:Pentatricopeptide repeat-containing protein n=1 Tax=Stephania cephalantha TaxID=152367 RepID=A0AAP0JG73_9MAGN
MVDLLARAGLIQEAYDFILEMPFDATASMWGSLLGSYMIYRNLELAEVAAKQLFEIEPNNVDNHVLLSNIYATNKRWEEVAWSRKLLKDSGTKKEMGKSWIEAKNKVHTFVAGQWNHPMLMEIHLKLESLEQEMKKLDYKVEIENDLHRVDENVKEGSCSCSDFWRQGTDQGSTLENDLVPSQLPEVQCRVLAKALEPKGSAILGIHPTPPSTLTYNVWRWQGVGTRII